MKNTALAFGVLALSLLDGCMTVYWVTSAQAVEANPFMRTLLDHSPVLFVTVKCALVALGLTILWRHRATKTLCFALLVYASIAAYHLWAITL